MSSELPKNIEGMSLDNPNIDKKVNAGTTAANCQPRHTRDALSLEDSLSDDDSTLGGEGDTDKKLSRSDRKAMKREKKNAAKKKKEEDDPKKMGYMQMAKMGYQELVNAIIRPPRAEYKVSDEYIRMTVAN